MTTNCKICSQLEDYSQIENKAGITESSQASFFPKAYSQLSFIFDKDWEGFGDKNSRLLKCPYCKTYYILEEWTPGGSDDAMITYIHESLQRISFEEAKQEMEKNLGILEKQANQYEGIFRDKYEIATKILQQELKLKNN